MAGGVVTVTGSGGTHIPVTVNGSQAYSLAQDYANAVNTAAANGTLTATNGLGDMFGPVGSPATPVNEFVATSGGFYTYPSGYGYFTTDTVSKVFIDASAATTGTVLNTLVGTGGAVYLAGSESGVFIAGGGNNLFINSGAGAYQVATSDGNDSIFAGSGSTTIAAGTGDNLVYLGAGADTVFSSGTDRIFASTGTATIDVTGSSSTIYGSSGALTVDDTQGTGTSISGGTGAASINGGAEGYYNLSGPSTVFAGNSDTIAASGASTVYGGMNTDFNETGTGSLLFIGTGGNSTVNSGAGTATVFGSNGSDITYSGAGTLVAGAGNETLNGAGSTQGFAAFVTNTGTTTSGAVIIGGTGSDTLVAGVGMQTLTGGSGAANVFDIAANGTMSAANITISDFGSATGNLVALYGYGANEVSAAEATAKTSGSNTTITLADKSTVTFANITNISTVHIIGG